MKFTPLNSQPNISHSRFESVSPSMRLDSRGYPHIAWLDKKRGHNEVHYSFWDGLHWGVREESAVQRSEEEIMMSRNGIIIDDFDQPKIAFSRKAASGSTLTLSKPSQNGWSHSNLSVTYDTTWIGIVNVNRGFNFSSSSSSSFGRSSSSSSSSFGISSSSSSFGKSSSSSSLGESSSSSSSRSSESSSSSLDSSSSSSSSSLDSSSSSSFSSSSSSSADSSSSSSSQSSSSSSLDSSSSSSLVHSSSSSSSSSSNSSISNSSSSSSSLESSSSSSLDSSSSSSSQSSYSSESSSSQSSESSRSSSSQSSESSSSNSSSSSSSSLDSSSSSSSSSIDDTNVMVCTYDGTTMRVYSVSDFEWILLGQATFTIDGASTMKLASCGNKVGLAYQDSTGIRYNFFDVELNSWSFVAFQTLQASTTGNVVDFDVDGYNREETGILSVGWLDDTTSAFYVRYTNVDSAGFEGVDGTASTGVITRSKNVQAGNYIAYGYQKIAMDLDAQNLPRILGSGAETTLYTQDAARQWSIFPIDMEGASSGFVPNLLALQMHEESGTEYAKVVFDNNEGDIYYFEDIGEDGFELVYPDLVVLNQERIFTTTWGCGELEGDEVYCTYTHRTGDMLRESLSKTVIVIDDNEDPACGTSSSSSSSSSSSLSSLGYSSSSSSSSSSSHDSSSSSSLVHSSSSSSSSSNSSSSSSSSSLDSSSSSSSSSSSGGESSSSSSLTCGTAWSYVPGYTNSEMSNFVVTGANESNTDECVLYIGVSFSGPNNISFRFYSDSGRINEVSSIGISGATFPTAPITLSAPLGVNQVGVQFDWTGVQFSTSSPRIEAD